MLAYVSSVPRLITPALLVVGACWTTPDTRAPSAPPPVDCGPVADHLVVLMPDVERRQLLAVLRGTDADVVEASSGMSTATAVETIRARVAESASSGNAAVANTDHIEINLDNRPMRDVLIERCVADRWSEPARQCLITVDRLWGSCAALLTASQRAAVAEGLDD